MHGERDLLTKYVFPELRCWCYNYCLNLYEVDLRWGITERQSQSDKWVTLCNSIDQTIYVLLKGIRDHATEKFSTLLNLPTTTWSTAENTRWYQSLFKLKEMSTRMVDNLVFINSYLCVNDGFTGFFTILSKCTRRFLIRYFYLYQAIRVMFEWSAESRSLCRYPWWTIRMGAYQIQR